ncbi:hypothetical protein BUALT_Bualt09G0119300 [Buddleja alternifolia]|uniref:Uncharacterized protein n=1 Tax=Buddleja alternifolia TaxID=168488 RepID=A0AAV6X982_9LAMI|nr:hypothetical protein BUALT_Bualt09G0119300 [Buddleja alternifolia]
MAQELDDGEFWLPSEFLTDDDLLTDHGFKTKRADDASYGFGPSFGFNSDLSSPVESVMGSTETESDEDDFIAGLLTRKIAQSTLHDSNISSDYTSKGWKLSGSPQSTLCGCKPNSSRGSPNCGSRISSPPDAKNGVGWDLLYAAAGEVARMRMIEETTPFYSAKLFAPPPKPSHPIPAAGFYPNQTQAQSDISYQQLQATQFLQMKQQQQQMMKSAVWEQGKIGYQFQNGRRNGRTQGLSSAAWPTLQQSQQQPQQPGSGMRAVFLGENGVKKERTGTGVFLPRRFGNNPTENTRKKPAGCSTVLLPDRVVHALNLNLDSVETQSQTRNNANFTPEYEAALKHRASLMMAQQRRSLRPHPHPHPQPIMNQELRLPQEWTY